MCNLGLALRADKESFLFPTGKRASDRVLAFLVNDVALADVADRLTSDGNLGTRSEAHLAGIRVLEARIAERVRTRSQELLNAQTFFHMKCMYVPKLPFPPLVADSTNRMARTALTNRLLPQFEFRVKR